MTSQTGGKPCIVVLFCLDGIQAFKVEGISLLPAEFCILSLPPNERYKAENMLLFMLLPHDLPTAQQAKFFRYVVREELADLHTTGVAGHLFRVLGISLDLKGRAPFLQQQAHNSYYGCSICTGRYEKALEGGKKVIFCGARQWLPRLSPLRKSYYAGFDFVREENRPPPPLRTTDSVFEAVALKQAENLRHYMGVCLPFYSIACLFFGCYFIDFLRTHMYTHAHTYTLRTGQIGTPMFASLPDFDYVRHVRDMGNMCTCAWRACVYVCMVHVCACVHDAFVCVCMVRVCACVWCMCVRVYGACVYVCT